jgi:hypothetical protein
METRSRSRPPLRRAASLALLLVSCDGAPRASDGSTLEGARQWEAVAGQATALDLPADALSVTLMAEGGPTDVLSFEIRQGERVLVEALSPESSINRLLRGRGLVVGAIPSSPAALPLASSLAVTAVALPPASAQPISVRAWVKRGLMGPEVPAVQELPLTLVLVGTDAPSGLDAALGELARIWRGAGIEVREPGRVRVEGPALVSVDPALGSDSPMVGSALRLSTNAAAGTLALVVVGDLALAGGDLGLWAITGSIPVPPQQGTPRSGVLVSAAFLRRDPTLGGQILAHEVGHALGLYHTTERPLEGGAPIHDQLEDTAACPASADRDGDGFLDASECSGHDAANLMFWATARGATRLTPAQGELARRSALVR